MSVWNEQQVFDKLVEVLGEVPVKSVHAFGRPYVTAYQLAVAVERAFPEVRAAIGYESVGGVGGGSRNSLAQYLANQLSRRIGADPLFPIEGAFLSNAGLRSLVLESTQGDDLVSSVSDSGYDLSLFRLRVEEW